MLAGEGFATDCAKIILFETIERAHYRVPQLPFETWIDDLAAIIGGTPAFVETFAVKGITPEIRRHLPRTLS